MDLPPFRPNIFFPGGDIQTIAGAFLPYRQRRYAVTRHTVDLPDGDAIVLNDRRPASWRGGNHIAMLVHGLGGSSESCYMPRVAEKLYDRGVRSFCVDLRGCGVGVALARRPSHAGRSDDVLQAIRYLANTCPKSMLTVIGFSMGGNIVLKLLGERPVELPENLADAIAIGPPIDLELSSRNVQRLRNRIYEWNYVRSLRGHVRRRKSAMPEVAHFHVPRGTRSLRQFDERFTAPFSGFASLSEYYALSSAQSLLSKIQTPTLLLIDTDDPLIPTSMFDRATMSNSIEFHITRGGGHLGYIARSGLDPDRRWMDWRIVDWTCRAR